MPMIEFKRPDGVLKERFYHVEREAPKSIVCPDGVVAVRCLVPSRVQIMGSAAGYGHHQENGKRGRVSTSTGVHPDQIPEMMAMFPHHAFDPKTGDQIFRDEMHKRRCLKDIGFHDADGNWSGKDQAPKKPGLLGKLRSAANRVRGKLKVERKGGKFVASRE